MNLILHFNLIVLASMGKWTKNYKKKRGLGSVVILKEPQSLHWLTLLDNFSLSSNAQRGSHKLLLWSNWWLYIRCWIVRWRIGSMQWCKYWLSSKYFYNIYGNQYVKLIFMFSDIVHSNKRTWLERVLLAHIHLSSRLLV